MAFVFPHVRFQFLRGCVLRRPISTWIRDRPPESRRLIVLTPAARRDALLSIESKVCIELVAIFKLEEELRVTGASRKFAAVIYRERSWRSGHLFPVGAGELTISYSFVDTELFKALKTRKVNLQKRKSSIILSFVFLDSNKCVAKYTGLQIKKKCYCRKFNN